MKTMARARRWLVVAVATLARPAFGGGVATDGSVGAKRTFTGSDIVIGSNFGRQVGGNLFHSFSSLDVAQGQKVTFTAAAAGAPQPINNVLVRVTGGAPTQIGGTLASTIDGADFFLLNPNGVVFGPQTLISVSGAFHVSTAHYVRLGSDGKFQTSLGDNSTLTSSAPQAFGFLAGRPAGTITVQGTIQNTPPVQIVGGNVQVAAGGQVAASSVAIVASDGAGEVPVASSALLPSASAATFPKGGSIEITNNGLLRFIDATLIADNITLDNAKLATDPGTSNDNLSNGVNVLARGTLTATGTYVIAGDANNGGPINFTAGSMTITSTTLLTQGFDASMAGITLATTTGPLTLDHTTVAAGGAQMPSATPAARGRAGAPPVRPTTLTGDAGKVTITSAGGAVTLTNAVITVDASGGSSDGVEITSPVSITLDQSNIMTNVGLVGGGISLVSPKSVTLTNSYLYATAGQSGANILIDPSTVSLASSTVNATAPAGNGGTVTILPDVLYDGTATNGSPNSLSATGGVNARSFSPPPTQGAEAAPAVTAAATDAGGGAGDDSGGGDSGDTTDDSGGGDGSSGGSSRRRKGVRAQGHLVIVGSQTRPVCGTFGGYSSFVFTGKGGISLAPGAWEVGEYAK